MSGAEGGSRMEAMEPGGGNAAARARFADRLDRLGPDVALWPAEAQAEAERLLADDAEAAAMLRAAASVETTLGTLLAVSAARPVVRRARSGGGVAPAWRRLAGFGMAALAASLVLGFVAGTALPSGGDDEDGGNDPIFMAVNDTDSGGLL